MHQNHLLLDGGPSLGWERGNPWEKKKENRTRGSHALMFQVLSLAKGSHEGTRLPDLGKEVPGLSVTALHRLTSGCPHWLAWPER